MNKTAVSYTVVYKPSYCCSAFCCWSKRHCRPSISNTISIVTDDVIDDVTRLLPLQKWLISVHGHNSEIIKEYTRSMFDCILYVTCDYTALLFHCVKQLNVHFEVETTSDYLVSRSASTPALPWNVMMTSLMTSFNRFHSRGSSYLYTVIIVKLSKNITCNISYKYASCMIAYYTSHTITSWSNILFFLHLLRQFRQSLQLAQETS